MDKLTCEQSLERRKSVMWFLGKGLPGSGHSGCKGPGDECAGRAEEQQGVLCGWGKGEKREGQREEQERGQGEILQALALV